METVYFILLGVAGLISLWSVISPRSVYWTLHAWQYRNAEANEPSDTAYAVTRFTGVLGVIAVITVGGFFITQAAERSEQMSLAEQCRTQWLPALEAVYEGDGTSRVDMQLFADEHDLHLDVQRFGATVVGGQTTPASVLYQFYSGDTYVLHAGASGAGGVECTVD